MNHLDFPKMVRRHESKAEQTARYLYCCLLIKDKVRLR